MITRAIASGASDIHIEPLRENVPNIRFRKDGILHQLDSTSFGYAESEQVISSLKVMAQLNITEYRRPQDGHIVFVPKILPLREPVDLRLSIFPTVLGEAAVLRILNRKDLIFERLENIGMDQNDIEKMRLTFQQSAGMVLVTGPGGSGKTTTLYTF